MFSKMQLIWKGWMRRLVISAALIVMMTFLLPSPSCAQLTQLTLGVPLTGQVLTSSTDFHYYSVDVTAKTPIPVTKTFFRPQMSAALPRGTRNAAAASRYEVATQLSMTAVMLKSSAIAGSATLIEEPMKGVRNELSIAIMRACLFWSG